MPPTATISNSAFRRKVKAILRDLDKNESTKLHDAIRYLKETRREIIDNLLRAEGFNELHLQRMLRETETSLREFERKFQRSLLSGVKNAFDGGLELVRAPLISSGLKEVALFVDNDLLRFSLQYSAEQIKSITENMLVKTNRILRQGLIGQKTSGQLMIELRKELSTKSAYGVERIVRTEINRALNLSEQRHNKQVAEIIPGLMKYWLHENDVRTRESHIAVGRATNPDYGGSPIPVGSKFIVGGHKADGPHDVSLPPEESINCRCVQILVTGET